MSATPARGRRRVGIDNYGLFPLDLTPLETLQWAVDHGADGVAFSGLTPEHHARLNSAALAELREFAGEHDLYLEWGGASHIPRDMTSWARRDVFEVNLCAAREARQLNTRIVRSCSGGLMRWSGANPPTEVLLADTADALRAQASMLRDHHCLLAIETHFEFTSFELLRLFEMCEAEPGDWLGICLDTMNLLTMIEEPVRATELLLPWIVSTHIKDGGVIMSLDGLTTFPVPIGAGVLDLVGIIQCIDTLPRTVPLSVEDHGGSFLLPIHDSEFLERFPDLTGPELAAIVEHSEVSAGLTGCRPVERDAWPAICESRMAGDLRALRALANRIPLAEGA